MSLPERPRLEAEDVALGSAVECSSGMHKSPGTSTTEDQRSKRKPAATPYAGQPREWLTDVPAEMGTQGPSVRNQKPQG